MAVGHHVSKPFSNELIAYTVLIRGYNSLVKCILRILAHIAAGLSLLLCIVTVVAWSKSNQRVHEVEPANTWQRFSSNTWVEIGSDNGYLYFLRISGTDMNHGAALDPTGQPGSHGDAVLMSPNTGGMYYKLRLIFWAGQMHGYDTGDSIRSMAYLENVSPSQPPTKPIFAQWQKGRAFARLDGFYPPNGVFPGYQILSIRYWLIVMLLAIAPSCLLVALIRKIVRKRLRHRRAKTGLCPQCGYDLRATPAQCPECGAIS